MNEKAITVSSDNKKETRWSQTTKKGDITESVSVEKLYNKGYLITLEKYGYESKDTKHEKYISVTRKLYSETNPLDTDESDTPFNTVFTTLGKSNN